MQAINRSKAAIALCCFLFVGGCHNSELRTIKNANGDIVAILDRDSVAAVIPGGAGSSTVILKKLAHNQPYVSVATSIASLEGQLK
jgi:hypothetical protein